MEFILEKAREAKDFSTYREKVGEEARPVTINLTKEQVAKLGNPAAIKVVITAS